MTRQRIFVLLGHDPATGLAVGVGGVLGIEPGGFRVSFVPYEPAAEPWRDRVLTASVPIAQAVERWIEEADGIAFDIAEISAPRAPDLRTAVESVVDELLIYHPAE